MKGQQQDKHPRRLMNQKLFDFPAIDSSLSSSYSNMESTFYDRKKAIGFKRAIFKGKKLYKYPGFGVNPLIGMINLPPNVLGLEIRCDSSPAILIEAPSTKKSSLDNQKETNFNFSDTIDTLSIPSSNPVDHEKEYYVSNGEVKSLDLKDSLPEIPGVKSHFRPSSADRNSFIRSCDNETDIGRNQNDMEDNNCVDIQQKKIAITFCAMPAIDVPSTIWRDDASMTEGDLYQALTASPLPPFDHIESPIRFWDKPETLDVGIDSQVPNRVQGQGQPSPSCSERKAASWQKAVGRLTAARDKTTHGLANKLLKEFEIKKDKNRIEKQVFDDSDLGEEDSYMQIMDLGSSFHNSDPRSLSRPKIDSMEGTNSLVEPNEILGTTPITQIKGPFRQISTLYENRLNDENYYENPYKGASYTISKYPGKIEPSEIYMSEKDMLSHNIKLKLELKLKLKQKNQTKYQNLEQIQHQDQQLGRLYHDRKRNKEITFFKTGSAGNYNRRLDEATSGKNVIFQRNHINGRSTDDRSLLPTPVLIPIKPTMKHADRMESIPPRSRTCDTLLDIVQEGIKANSNTKQMGY